MVGHAQHGLTPCPHAPFIRGRDFTGHWRNGLFTQKPLIFGATHDCTRRQPPTGYVAPSTCLKQPNWRALPESSDRVQLASIHPSFVPVGQPNLNPIAMTQHEFGHRFPCKHFVDTLRPIRRLRAKRDVAQMRPCLSQCTRHGQTISKTKAEAPPPPLQMPAAPLVKPRSLRAWINVTTTREPLEPSGCPNATAPPWMLTH